MPKGTRKISSVGNYGRAALNGKYQTKDSKGKVAYTDDPADLRTLVGDKKTKFVTEGPEGLHVKSTGHSRGTEKARSELARRKKAKAEKAKATVDKAGKDAIELVRRKKSTYRDDYKD